MQAALRLIAALLVLAVLGTVAAAGWWKFADKEAWRPVLQASFAGQNAGLTIGGIEGNFSKGGPVLTLHDVQLADAGQAPFFTAPRLTVTLSPLAAWRHEPAARSVDLDSATVTQPLRLLALLGQQGGLQNFRATETAIVANGQTIILHELTAVTQPRLRVVLTGLHDGAPMELDLQAGTLEQLADGAAQPLAAALNIAGHDVALSAIYSRRPLNGQVWQLLDKLTVKLDGQTLTGAGAVNLGVAPPRIVLTLTAPTWNIAGAGASSPTPDGGPLFSRAALPWQALSWLDGAMTLSVDKITHGALNVGPAYVQAQLQDGALALTVLGQPMGSPQSVRLDLQANAGQQLALHLAAPQLDLTGSLPTPIKAPVMVQADLAASGASPHDLAQSAAGQVSVQMAGGKLDATVLPDAARRPLEFLFGPDRLADAALSCLKADFTPGANIVPNVHIGLTSDVVNLAGTGQVDLGSERMVFALVAAPLVPPLAGVHLPLDVMGDIRNPGLGADTQAALKQLAAQTAGRIASTMVGTRLGKTLGDKAGALANTLIPGEDHMNVAMPPNPCAIPVAAPSSETAAADEVTGVQGGLFALIPPQMQAEIDGARTKLTAPLTDVLGPLLKGNAE